MTPLLLALLGIAGSDFVSFLGVALGTEDALPYWVATAVAGGATLVLSGALVRSRHQSQPPAMSGDASAVAGSGAAATTSGDNSPITITVSRQGTPEREAVDVDAWVGRPVSLGKSFGPRACGRP